MPITVTLEQIEQNAVRSIALAAASRTRESRLHTLGDTFGGMSKGALVLLDNSDLSLWSEDLPTIVANVKPGATLDNSARKLIGAFRAAAVRELRKVTKNDNADFVGGFYQHNGATHYGLTRTA